jgi:hypothetical protein
MAAEQRPGGGEVAAGSPANVMQQGQQDLNLQPAVLETAALPV